MLTAIEVPEPKTSSRSRDGRLSLWSLASKDICPVCFYPRAFHRSDCPVVVGKRRSGCRPTLSASAATSRL